MKVFFASLCLYALGMAGCMRSEPTAPPPGPGVKVNAPGVKVDVQGKDSGGGVKVNAPGVRVDVPPKN
jgi:hypothetical protein